MNTKSYKNPTKPFWNTRFIDNFIGRKLLIAAFNSKIFFKLHSAINGFIGLCFVIALLFSFSSCEQKTKIKGPEYSASPVHKTAPVYHFAIHPLHNPAKLIQVYQPLIDYLNSQLKGAQLSLEASRDYANFEEKYKNRRPEIILPNPWQTLQAMKYGYTIIAEAGDPKDFKGIFIVRKDSGIHEPADLKGKTISYPSATAVAACIMPQYFLYSHGINVNKDIKNRYVGSQESSIMNVYLKMTSAGATWPMPWRAFQKEHQKEASQLKVIWETESLVSNSVMVSNDIPANIGNQIQKYLVEMNKTKQGKTILSNMATALFIKDTNLEAALFIKASNKDYAVVQTYMNRFEKEVRKIE